MLTLRSCSLTSLGLLTGFVAVAQTPNVGPTPTTLLSWVVWFLAGVVLLMAVMTAGSVTSAAQRRYEAEQAEPTAAEVVAAAPAPIAVVAAQTVTTKAAPQVVTIQEAVYA
jgi:formate hydrogenlyase subunit 3/multisubunit Na+/H+ antiporter MnhD subunit